MDSENKPSKEENKASKEENSPSKEETQASKEGNQASKEENHPSKEESKPSKEESKPSKEEHEAAFVENYFDCVEEFPNDVQREMSRMRELEVRQGGIVKELYSFMGIFDSNEPESDEAIGNLLQIGKLLMSLDEVGEEKCEVSQSITDLVDERVQRTEELAKNLETTSEETASEETGSEETGSEETASDDSSGPSEETLAEIEREHVSKRKYCICDKEPVEGGMFMCDNEECPVEWFHPDCVELKSKPKRRKWFCPLCRGEDSNVMKPEADEDD